MGQEKLPKIKAKRSDKSVLAVAEKSHTTQEPSRLSHVTTSRIGAPGGRKRKPPSRKPMHERTTKLETDATSEDVSLVIEKKETPKGFITGNSTPRKIVSEKDKEILSIENNKKKSTVENVGKKSVMRIFLDNNGIAFKTVAITPQCTMYELVDIMRKKVFTDTTGFGIWEVRDKTDVALIDPRECVGNIMDEWGAEKAYKFVFKKALGEKAKLYFNAPSERASTSSMVSVNPMGAPMPKISGLSAGSHLSNPLPKRVTDELQEKPKNASVSLSELKEATLKREQSSSSSSNLTANLAKQETPKISPKRAPPPLSKESSSSNTSPPEGEKRSSRRPAPALPGGQTKSPNTSPQRGIPRGRGVPQRGISPQGGPTRGGVQRGVPLNNRGGVQRGVSSPRGSPTVSRANVASETISVGIPTSKSNDNMSANGMDKSSPPTNTTSNSSISLDKPSTTSTPVQNESSISLTKSPTPTEQPSESKTKSIEDWTIEEVADWIAEIGFQQIRNIFVENYISGSELVELTNEELKEDLGVQALGARKAILREIKKLQDNA